MDLTGYDALLSGELTDYALPDDELKKFTDALKDLLEAEMRKSGRW